MLLVLPIAVSSLVYVSPPQQVVRTFHDLWTSHGAAPMVALEDLDEDGFREILIGQSSTGQFGELRILSGDSGEIVQRITFREFYLGYQAAFLGDVTGDGFGDFLGSGYLGNRG